MSSRASTCRSPDEVDRRRVGGHLDRPRVLGDERARRARGEPATSRGPERRLELQGAVAAGVGGRLDDGPVVDELQAIEGRDATGRRMDVEARPAPIAISPPSPTPSTERSMNGPLEVEVRPDRTASVQVSQVVGPAPDLRVRPQPADGHAGAHLVGAADERDAQAAVEQAIPLAHGVGVDTGPEVADLEGVNPSERDVRDHLAVRIREVGDDGQPAAPPAVICPLRDAGPGRVPEVRLVRPGRAEWSRDPPAGPEQRQVPEDVLAVLGPDPDERVVAADRRQLARDVADVRVEVAPLGGEQVDDAEAFRLTLQPGRLGREEVDMGVGGDPALASEVARSLRWIDDRVGGPWPPAFTTSLTGSYSKPLTTSRNTSPAGRRTWNDPGTYA